MNRTSHNNNNSTGCPLLDKAGVLAGSAYKRADICLECPYEECIVKDRDDKLEARTLLLETEEKWVQCSVCGATETLTFIGGRLDKTSRWQQKDGKIIHLKDCGEMK